MDWDSHSGEVGKFLRPSSSKMCIFCALSEYAPSISLGKSGLFTLAIRSRVMVGMYVWEEIVSVGLEEVNESIRLAPYSLYPRGHPKPQPGGLSSVPASFFSTLYTQ